VSGTNLETLSFNLMNSATIVYGAAMVAFAYDFAFSGRMDRAVDGAKAGAAGEASTASVASEGSTKTAKKAADRPGKGGRNPFAFVWNYLKQVVAELRKVIWPNRKQMINYTAVVLVFLAFMVALIGGVDFGLAKLVMLVFG